MRKTLVLKKWLLKLLGYKLLTMKKKIIIHGDNFPVLPGAIN